MIYIGIEDFGQPFCQYFLPNSYFYLAFHNHFLSKSISINKVLLVDESVDMNPLINQSI